MRTGRNQRGRARCARVGELLSIAAVATLGVAALHPTGEARPSEPSRVEGGYYAYSYEALAIEDPVEAWRLDYEEIHSETLADGTGLAYVVASDSKGRHLLALWVETGEVFASAKLKKGGRAHLDFWDGGVLVSDEDNLTTYALEGDELEKGKAIKGPWGGEPSVHGRWAFVNDAKRKAHCVDLEKGKKVDDGRGGYGQLGVAMSPDGDTATIYALDYGSPMQSTRTGLIQRKTTFSGLLEGKKVEADSAGEEFIAEFFSAPKKDEMAGCRQVRWEQGGSTGWFIVTPMNIKASNGSGAPAFLFNETASSGSIWDVSQPVAWDPEAGHMLLVLADGVCRRLQPGTGGSAELKKIDYMPDDFVPGPVSTTGGVMFSGNLAIRIANGELLYLLEDAEPTIRMSPVADQRVVYATQDGDLVCLADPAHMAVVAAAREAAASPIHQYRGVDPLEGDGVVLDTGQFLPGVVDLEDDGSAVVELPSGEALTFPKGRVIAASLDGERIEVDSRHQFGWFAAWRNHVLAQHCERSREHFDEYLALAYVEDCERMLGELRKLHADVRTLDEWSDALDRARVGDKGKQSKRDAVRKAERRDRERTQQAFVEAGEWAIEAELPLAAAALLDQAETMIGGDEAVSELAQDLVQPGFPWAERANATRLWMRWSSELLPASGEFVPADDPFWEHLADTEWEDAIAVRSPRVTLVCKDDDPAAIGTLLRYAEGGVRALQEVLPVSEENAVWIGEEDRLEVRVHRNRREYLDEKSPDGEPFAMPWSAGFYSPGDEVSRFYLERDQVTNEVVVGSLNQVMVHELTHHYIDMWWAPGSRGGTHQPGYWIVEGFARFVEDQVAELGAGEETTWDDVQAGCVQATINFASSQRALPLADLIDLQQAQFAGLDDDLRGIFYEQSGALVFYLFNECGPEVRQNLLDYVEAYYEGDMDSSGWERLGFETSTLLQDGFFAWLMAL